MPADKPRRRPDYRLEILDGELLLYHPTQTTIMYCNQTASLIWQLCDGTHTVQDISTLLADAYPEAATTIPDDVTSTLESFTQHDVIEWL